MFIFKITLEYVFNIFVFLSYKKTKENIKKWKNLHISFDFLLIFILFLFKILFVKLMSRRFKKF